MNADHSQNRKNTKFILNVLYNDKRVYESKNYKNLIKGFIQIFCKKINLEKMSYQAVYRKIKEKMGLYTALIYFTINKSFNCNLYITNIRKRILQQLKLSKNELQTFYIQAE